MAYMNRNLRVAVVIPFYNEALYILPLLESLVKQRVSEGFGWHAVFVDNDSTDSTAAMIRTSLKRSRVSFEIIKEPRRGTVFSRKTGLDAASRLNPEIIISTDADTVVPPDFIRTTYKDCAGVNTVVSGRREINPRIDLWKRLVSKELYAWQRKFRNLEYRLFGPYFFGAYFAIGTRSYQTIPDFEPEKHEQYLGEDILLSRRCYYLNMAFVRSSVSVIPNPRRDLVLGSEGVGKFIGNAKAPYANPVTEERLVYTRLKRKDEQVVKLRFLKTVTERLIWEVADAYGFWIRTGNTYRRARESAERGLAFLGIPVSVVDFDKELRRNTLFNTLKARYYHAARRRVGRLFNAKTP